MDSKYTAMLRLPEVSHRTGISKSQIHRMVEDGDFPEPVRLSKRAVAFVAAEVESWLQARIAASRQTPA